MAGQGPENAACHAGNCRGRAYGWLKKRREFLNVAKGSRAHSAAFVLQCAVARGGTRSARDSGDDQDTGGVGAAPDGPQTRFGLTVSRKNGNSVIRNRIKRRLRAALAEAARPGLRELGVRDGYDHVIVARPDAVDYPYETLVSDLRKMLAKLHTGGGRGRGRNNAGAPARSKAGRTI